MTRNVLDLVTKGARSARVRAGWAMNGAARRLTGRTNTWWDNQDAEYLRQQFLRDPIEGVDHPSRRWVRDWLRAHPGLTLLDIPCGPGVEYEGFRREDVPVTYMGMDVTDTMLATVRRSYPEGDFRPGNILKIPLPDDAVDVVLCRHIIEHLEDHRPAIREAVRVARSIVLIVLFRVPTHSERRQIGWGAWDNRLEGGPLDEFLASLGVAVESTRLPYPEGLDLPRHVEENTILELKLP